jgi:beta-glucosidase
VFGEHPYAEFLGDLTTIDYQHGNKSDLKLLRRLHAAHIPVVALFVSGRPLLVTQEIASADAFVAAWLPGSQGGGIADLLIGDASGAPRYRFTGSLSYAWPATKSRTMFPIGFGLHN